MNGSVPGPLLVEHPGECLPTNPVQFVLVPVIYCLVLCVGLPGNLVALLVFLQSGKVRKAIRIYLINLTLADILFNLTLPLWIHYYLAGGDWLLSEATCPLPSGCPGVNRGGGGGGSPGMAGGVSAVPWRSAPPGFPGGWGEAQPSAPPASPGWRRQPSCVLPLQRARGRPRTPPHPMGSPSPSCRGGQRGPCPAGC
uniref:G-protein coupled receptors family 1 profile domain-containing protein n=1 Tax=Serinus canaria TaxID=9135 RepID=A0A8C9NSC5_SERCA